MKQFKKIIFVCGSDTCRAPMAEAVMKRELADQSIEVQSRGLIVLFPEPLNQKAEAVMISNGLVMEGHMSKPLEEEDFDNSHLIVALERKYLEKIYSDYEKAKNVFLLTELVGERGDVFDPYGGPLTDYGKCYEQVNHLVARLAQKVDKDPGGLLEKYFDTHGR